MFYDAVRKQGAPGISHQESPAIRERCLLCLHSVITTTSSQLFPSCNTTPHLHSMLAVELYPIDAPHTGQPCARFRHCLPCSIDLLVLHSLYCSVMSRSYEGQTPTMSQMIRHLGPTRLVSDTPIRLASFRPSPAVFLFPVSSARHRGDSPEARCMAKRVKGKPETRSASAPDCWACKADAHQPMKLLLAVI